MTDEAADPLEMAAYYVGSEQPREALDVLRRADPADLRTYRLRGQALLQLAQCDEAEQQLRHGLTLDPENVILLMQLAQAQTPRDAAAAEVTLRTALALDPDNVSLLGTYVNILMEQGRFESAEKILDRAMKIAPEEMQMTRTLFLLRVSREDTGHKAAQDLLRDAPDDATAHYLQGIALLDSGRVMRGLRHLREAAALRPADPLYAAAARKFGAWYLWPVYLTNGPVDAILLIVVVVAAMITADRMASPVGCVVVVGPWLAFLFYKRVAMLLLNRRVARAALKNR